MIREAIGSDAAEIHRMRCTLLPDEEHENETARYFAQRRDDEVILVAISEDGTANGFVEVGSRSFAEGCESSPVAYIEGWYVDPDHRRRGIGRALFTAAEGWARANGFREIGSDAVLGNDISVAAHTVLGYDEVVRIVCFRRLLTPMAPQT